MSKGINIHCSVCGSSKHQHIPSKYGESGHTTEEVYVAGCDKCAKKTSTSYASSGGSYSSSGGSSSGGGCGSTLAAILFFAFFFVCCCGGLTGKS